MPGLFKVTRKRRLPYPYDIRIDGVGFLLGKRDDNKDTPLIATTVPPLQAQAPEFHYGAENPIIEQTFSMVDFTGGFGQRYIRQQGDEKRYYYALGADASVQGLVINGPAITAITPSPTVDSTNGISAFWEQSSGGTTKLFALDGRYALVRNGDLNTDWTVSKDFGAGNVAQDVIVVKQTGGATTYAFVALFNSSGVEQNWWYYTGASDTTVWTQHATLTARCWARVSQPTGEFLYRAYSTNKVDRCDLANDPTVAGNWTGAYNVGDATSPIVRLVVHPDGTLYVMKTDGIYILNSAGTSTKLYAGLSQSPSAENGKWNFIWENWIHTTYGGSHYRIGPGGSLEPIGPERAVENKSEVRGYITAGRGTPFQAYAGLYNTDTSTSYLLKFGSWITQEDGEAHRADAWHGALQAGIAGAKVGGMFNSTIGAAAGHQRLYIGYSDGSVRWFLLPCVPNPTGCSSYAYNTSVTLYTSYWDGGFPLTNKHFRWAAASGKFSSNEFVRLDCSTNEADSWGAAPLGTTNITTTPGQQVDFIADQVGTNISFEYNMFATASISPIITGVGFAFGLRVPVTLIYEFSILAENNLVRHDGVPVHIGADRIRTLAKTAATTTGSVTTYLPDETSLELSIISYEEGMAWDERTQRWREAIHLRGVQTAVGTANYSGSSRPLGS